MLFQSKPHKIAQLILAAGSSSRMGTPKQLLPWRGTTLLEYAIQQTLDFEEIDAYVILGAYYDKISKLVDKFPIKIVQNIDWQLGMGTTIRCGIHHIQKESISYDAVLISLIDQPLLGREHFQQLISCFYKNTHTIVATGLKNKIGVPAIVSSIYFDELSNLHEDYGARYLIRQFKDEVKTIDANGKGKDIDTIEEYKYMVKNDFL